MGYEEKIKCVEIKKYHLQNSQEIRERDINNLFNRLRIFRDFNNDIIIIYFKQTRGCSHFFRFLIRHYQQFKRNILLTDKKLRYGYPTNILAQQYKLFLCLNRRIILGNYISLQLISKLCPINI